MKNFICVLFLLGSGIALRAQSIIGNWQLIKQTNCVEENLPAGNEKALVDEMKTMTAATPQVISFKEKLTGEESTRILTHKKSVNNKNFLYKFDGESLMILDKKSQTISENYIVEKFSTDSLILSNAARPCETKIFMKIK